MKRNIFRLILSAALMMCCTVMTWGLETQPYDEIWYTSSDANVIKPFSSDAFGATIQSNTYNGDKGVIKFDGPVTMIGKIAFLERTNLKSINIPTSVTSIGQSAFEKCTNLSRIEIPNSVTSVGSSAFSGCSGLTSIVVDEGNEIYDSHGNCNAIIETATNTLIIGCQNTTIPNSLEKIGVGAFRDCTNLQSINIPTSVTSIGQSAFEKCTNLSRIEIPNSVTSVGSSAFSGCTRLTSVSVVSGSIGSDAFADCANLSTVTLYDETTGNGVTSIGEYAFYRCSKLESINIPTTVTSIGESAFETCSSLTKIEIPNSVTSIGHAAFGACTGLTSVSVTSGSIGNYAFAGCSSVSIVTLGEGVTSIGGEAFKDCGKLNKITIPGTVKSMGLNVFLRANLNDVTIEDGAYIGEYTFQYYKGKLTINGSLSGVGELAFEGCTSLTTISVTSGSIGHAAFRDCTNLSTVTLGEGVTSIGAYAFTTCSSLVEIEIPNTVTSIGEHAFSGCTGLTSVSVTSGSIEGKAFRGCANLSKVTLYDETTGNGVASIGEYAFCDCNILSTIKIPGTVKSMGPSVFLDTNLNDVTIEDGAYIGDNAFNYYNRELTINGSLSGVGEYAFIECTSLTSISVTSGSIGKYAFAGCTNLSKVTLYDETTGIGVTSIGGHAFYKCSKLESINIPTTVTSIGESAFETCSSLTKIEIPNSVTSIGHAAFRGCIGLTSVSVTSGSIGDDAFAGCTNLSKVTLQDETTGIGVTSIEEYAFHECSNLEEIEIPNSVMSIGKYAFGSCTNLKVMFVKWTEAEKIPSIGSNVFSNIDLAKETLYVPTYTTALYNAKDVWKDFNVYEYVNFIITKTDDTTIGQNVVDGGGVTIDESEDDIKSLSMSENVSNVSVTYIRNFANADKWQGWYVPFDVPLADMTKVGLDVAEIYGILLDNSGKTVIAFLKMETGTVKANTPYVVRPNTSGKVDLTTKTTIHQTEETSMFMMSIADKYTIGGIYEQTTTPGNWYAINKEGQFQLMGTDVSLRPFRIWMTIDPREDNPYAPSVEAKAKMDIVVLGDDDTTGIEKSLQPSTLNPQPSLYNLNGQRVNSIQKGKIYIMNGKKYIAR